MNILVLTSAYPQPDDDEKAGITPVVHYFTREWVLSGNEVMVIHNANKYPKIFYMLTESIIQKINSKFSIVVPKISQRIDLTHIKDGVNITRFPMLKILPKRKFFDFQIRNQFKKIVKHLEDNKFIPDVVIGHWENPQIPLISMLKQKYDCKTALTIHGIVYLKQKSCRKWIEQHLENIDILGCRSRYMADEIKLLLSLDKDPFVCYSGIPDDYINSYDIKEKSFNSDEFGRFIYVGQLIRRKNLESVIKALNNSFPTKKFTFEVIGVGAHETTLKSLVNKLDLQKNVFFLGRKTRTEVLKLMENNQYFSMISSDEIFGLVYLEAMASGCIVIASKNEGIDGIIIDAVNGFLCKAGDENELSEIYTRINNMTNIEKKTISENAIKTAKEFKDSIVAEKYLENILGNNI